MYWLKTRHYDPKVGRFLTQDSLDYLDHETLGGLNLYAYCLNNPVNGIDPDGHFGWLLAVLIGGAIAGGFVGGFTGYKKGETGLSLLGHVLLGVSIGIATAGLIVAASSALAGAMGASAVWGGLLPKTAFAIGALAYNSFAFIVAPILGISVQGIEMGGSPYQPNKPQQNKSKYPY